MTPKLKLKSWGRPVLAYPDFSISSYFAWLVAVFVAMPLLTGCNKPSTEDAVGASQVIARVNDTEISMWQYNHALLRSGVDIPTAAVKKELASKLVDRELALQAALVAKLDRQPDVMLQLEEARRDVLARAWAERTAADTQRPDNNAAARYYKQHPELFTQRKIYHLREAAFAADLPQLDEVKNRLARGASYDQVIDWLSSQKVRFNQQKVIRAAEQLPIQSLSRLNTASKDQVVFFESPRGVLAYQILSVQSAPLDWETARPIILDYLRKKAGKRSVDAETDRLRNAAQISHLGEFSALFAAQAEQPTQPPQQPKQP